MKPEWKDAPEWAEWLTQCYYGYWTWWEKLPQMHPAGIWYKGEGRHQSASGSPNKNNIEWRNTLEPRPKEKEMKFKVGDRVVLARPDCRNRYDRELLEMQDVVGFLVVDSIQSDKCLYVGGVDGGGRYVRPNKLDWHTPHRTPTERRLIETLRPFAEEAHQSLLEGGMMADTKCLNALNLLEQLGEYHEVCKECGQELKDSQQ